MAIRKRLLTQDRLFFKTDFDSLVCPLCQTQPDNHDHLFFECPFSKSIWDRMKDLARILLAPNKLSQVVEFFQLIPWSIIQIKVGVGCFCVLYLARKKLKTF